jgi:hypothetical protein
LFEGRRIRCQIISVPGQATLAPRRRRLLESADAIVFVGDSTPVGFAADRAYLSGLQVVLESLSGPPVGIVFQANKRDHADAVPIETVRSMLTDLGLRVGVVESVATESSGIREAFVFAVRLALDRVRDLMRTGELASVRPEVDSAQELLEDLKRSEDGSLDYAALSGLVHTRLADVQPDTMLVRALAEAVGHEETPPAGQAAGANGAAGRDYAAVSGAAANGAAGHDYAAVSGAAASGAAANGAATNGKSAAVSNGHLEPATPDHRVASGLIWPPVDGRVILHELAQANVALTRSDEGGWSAVANGRWRMHSAAESVFNDVEDGRAILVQSARTHAAAREKTTPFCITLAADGHGRYRLWRSERIS